MNTGTPASAASWAPTWVSRPTVVSPSDSSTMAPGATSSSMSSPASRTSRSAPVDRASPMAVDSASSRSSMPSSRRSRSSVGSTSTATLPLKEIRPTSMSSATWSTNSRAACLAASRRVGDDVGRHHRQRHVEQHEDAPLARGALGRRGDRPGDGHDTGGQAEQHEHGDHVAAPARSRRRHAVEEVDLGEAHGRPTAPQLRGDVAGGEGDDSRAATTSGRRSRKSAAITSSSAPGR